jgi:toxin-antitoxin system PIN domain toxin
MVIPDVNVLVGAFAPAHPDHAEYAQVVTRLAEGPEPYGLSELALSGFLRVATAPGVLDPPAPLETALEFVDSLADRPNARLLRPGLEHFHIFLRLLGEAGCRGKVVADAYHAALAIEHGCEWLSADADFMRFKDLRVRHPLRPR